MFDGSRVVVFIVFILFLVCGSLKHLVKRRSGIDHSIRAATDVHLCSRRCAVFVLGPATVFFRAGADFEVSLHDQLSDVCGLDGRLA